jgi:hypothetical protein
MRGSSTPRCALRSRRSVRRGRGSPDRAYRFSLPIWPALSKSRSMSAKALLATVGIQAGANSNRMRPLPPKHHVSRRLMTVQALTKPLRIRPIKSIRSPLAGQSPRSKTEPLPICGAINSKDTFRIVQSTRYAKRIRLPAHRSPPPSESQLRIRLRTWRSSDSWLQRRRRT